MCKPGQILKLCSCGEIYKNKKAFWELKLSSRHDTLMATMGDIVPPEFHEPTLKDERNEMFLFQLNHNDCFDFDYKPKWADELIIYWKGLKHQFLFGTEWELADSPYCEVVKRDRHEEIKKGKVSFNNGLVSPKDIVKVVYDEGGYGRDSIEYVVTEKSVQMSEFEMFKFSDMPPSKLEESVMEDWEGFTNYLISKVIPNWSKTYNSDILDGTQWTLGIYTSEGVVSHIYGSNNWPEDFEDFMKYFTK